MSKLVKSDTAFALPQASADLLLRACLRDLLAESANRRRRAGEFLVYAATRDVLTCPSWPELVVVFGRSKDPVVRAELARLATLSVDRGESDRDEVIRALAERLRVSAPDSELPVDHESSVLRRQLVYLMANRGMAQDVPELLRLAFRPPVDAAAVRDLAGFIVPGAHRPVQPPIGAQLELVREVGRSLTRPGVTGNARKDTPGAWRGILAHLLNRADDTQLVTLLVALPLMHERFAARLVGCLPVRAGSPLPGALGELADLPGEVAQEIDRYLERYSHPDPGWPDLDEALAAARDEGLSRR